jgi:hypothetical protein
MAIYMWRERTSVLDEVVGTSYSTTNGDTYYRWISITPKVNCTLDKVVLANYGTLSWTLQIWTWDYGSTQTLASVTLDSTNTSWWVYDASWLDIQLTAGSTYWIRFTWWTIYTSSSWVSMPLSWENVTINNSFTTQPKQFTNRIFAIQWVYTTAV